jgi:hypothetical protein
MEVTEPEEIDIGQPAPTTEGYEVTEIPTEEMGEGIPQIGVTEIQPDEEIEMKGGKTFQVHQPTKEETEVKRVKAKVENFSTRDLKMTLRDAGMKQAGTREEMIERITTGREAVETVGKKYGSGREILDAVDSGEIDRATLFRFAKAVAPGNTKVDEIGTHTNARQLTSWLYSVMGNDGPTPMSDSDWAQWRRERDKRAAKKASEGQALTEKAPPTDLLSIAKQIQAPAKEQTALEEKHATEEVEPTGEASTTAETYSTAHPEFEGLILSFKPGDDRHGRKMTHYYGEIAGTEDADNMPVDVVLNKDYESAPWLSPIFIVNQKDPETGEFRQHKVMAGFKSAAAAKQGYIDEWGGTGFDSAHKVEDLKDWLKRGNTKKPYSRYQFKNVKDKHAHISQPMFDAPDELIPGMQRLVRRLQKKSMDELVEYARKEGFNRRRVPDSRPSIIEEAERRWLESKLEEGKEARAKQQTQDEKDQAKADRALESSIRQAKNVRANLVPDPRTDDLITYIRKLGGLNMDNQSDIPKSRDLKALNKRNRIVGLPGIEQYGDKGLSLSAATEAAFEADFIRANDETEFINLMFEAEGDPIYSLQNEEWLEREEQAEFERAEDEYAEQQANAMSWEEFIRSGKEDPELAGALAKEFTQTDPETARLMSLAGAIDHDTMVDIASKEAPEEDIQALLQEYINENQSPPIEAAPAEEPTREAGPVDETEPATTEEQADLVGKTEAEKAQQAIEDAKREKEEKIPVERPAEAQSGDDLFAAGGQLEPDLFSQPAQEEVAAPNLAKKEGELTRSAEGFERVLEKMLDPNEDKDKWRGTALDILHRGFAIDPEAFLRKLEEVDARLEGGIKGIAGANSRVWRDYRDVKEAWDAEPEISISIEKPLGLSRGPALEGVGRGEIKLTAEMDGKKITHNAEWWLNAIDQRLYDINKLRGCMK